MPTVKKVMKHLDLIAGSIFLVILIVSCTYAVFSRFLFNKPIFWFEAYAKYALMAIVVTAAPYVARIDGHICMRELLFRFPKAVQKVVFLLIDLCCVGFFGLVCYSGIVMIRNNRSSYMIGFNQPYWQFYLPLVLGFALMVIMYAYKFYEHLFHSIPQPIEVEEFDLDADMSDE